MIIFLIPILVGILQLLGIIHLHSTGANLCDLTTGVAMGAPFLINALMGPQKSSPGMPGMIQPNLYPEYQKKLLESGFSPRSDLYKLASDQSRASLNRQGASQGLGRSGLNMAAQTEAQTDLANKFLSSETERQAMAYKAAVSPNVESANSANQYSANMYKSERDAYNDYLAQRSGLGGAFSNLLTTGAKYFASQPKTTGGENLTGQSGEDAYQPDKYSLYGTPTGYSPAGYNLGYGR